METTDILRIMIIALFVIFIFITVVAGGIYFNLRQYPAIRARRPIWCLINCLVLILMQISFNIDILVHYPPCSKIMSSPMIWSALTLDIFNIRCWIILHSWNSSKALTGNLFKSDWWLKHTHLVKSRFLIHLMVFGALFHLSCWLGIVCLFGWKQNMTISATSIWCIPNWSFMFCLWAPLFVQINLSVYLSYQLRMVLDVFQIRNELLFIGGIWPILVFPWFFIQTILPELQSIEWLTYMYGNSQFFKDFQQQNTFLYIFRP